MRKIVFILLSILLLSCSISDDSSTPPSSAKWNLINITGGISGTEIVLDRGQITWVFDEANSILIIEEIAEGLPDGLIKGDHTFSIENINNDDFIFIDGVEYGSIAIGSNTFTIDQNVTSTGSASDLYIFKFVR